MKTTFGAGLLLFAFAAGGAVVPRWLAPTPVAPAAITAVSRADKTSETVVGTPLLAGQHGRVHEVFCHAGQSVRRGQVLLKLLQKQPSVRQQQLQRRLAQQQQAYADLVRQSASPQRLEAAQAQLTSTRSLLARAIPMLNFVFVTAPTDGLLLAPRARAGDQLGPDSLVAYLAPLPTTDTTSLLSHVE